MIIYTLNCPITGIPKYVGQTKQSIQKRLKDHCYVYGNDKKKNWIRELKQRNLLPTIEILDEVEDNLSDFWEIYWISQLISWGFDLKNGTSGGNCVRLTGESLEKMKRTMNSDKVLEKLRTSKLGDKNPAKRPEVRKKISEKAKNRVRRGVIQNDKDGNFIKEWKSMKEAATYLSQYFDRTVTNMLSCIYSCAKGKHNTAMGYNWKYLDNSKS